MFCIFFCFLSVLLIKYFEKSVYLTHYSPVLLIYTSEKVRKPLGFLMFSGGIDKQHQAVMG